MRYEIKDNILIYEKIEKMSIEELLYSVICPNIFSAKEIPNKNVSCIFMHPMKKNDAIETAKLINSNSSNKRLIVTDMEAGPANGIKGATSFPSLLAAAKTKDPKLCYEMGKITAIEAKNAGYHWTFGPVVDMLVNFDNPMTSIRSAGSDFNEVIKYAGSYLKGLKDYGLVSTIKHFPGDGYSVYDQHLTTPVNNLTKEEWDKTIGKIYQTLIDDGIKSVMIGHIALPAYDEIDQLYDLYPPASISKNIMNDLLKEQLGFKGLIVSDAVNMGGFCGYKNLYDASAEFLQNGGDLLLFMKPTDIYIEEMTKRINDKKLDLNILKNRAYRVLCFVEEIFTNNKIEAVDEKNADLIAKEVVDKSILVYRDRHKIIPQDLKNKKILYVHIGKQHNMEVINEFKAELNKVTKVSYYENPGSYKLLDVVTAKEVDLIICSIGTNIEYGTNMTKLTGDVARNMMDGWMKYDVPVIFVDFFHPFIHEEYNTSIDTLIYTYGYSKHTVKRVVDIIQGN